MLPRTGRDNVQGRPIDRSGARPIEAIPQVLPRPKALSVKEVDPNRVGYRNGIVSAVDLGIILNEEEDLADALSPINDQLSLPPIWWLLVFLPMRQKCLGKDGTWGTRMKSSDMEPVCRC